jgi:Rha family phage regulatory protein
VNDMVPVAPVVTLRDGETFTDSRNVAAVYEKQHGHVLEAIRILISRDPEAGPDFRPFEIQGLSYPNRGKISHYEMTETGWMLLTLPFTGAPAAKKRRLFVAAFQAMRAHLLAPPTGPELMARALLEAHKIVDDLTAKNAVLQIDSRALGIIEKNSEGSFSLMDAAKTLQCRRLKGSDELDARAQMDF